ncbi:MAG TPA: alpha/beta hydrolase family protein [Bryobacteraceae bacterium]|nr:alpha/beta hydrolase family protein [Bryobacteraceae bacterium]
MTRTALFALAALFVLPPGLVHAQKDPFIVTRRVFADLLKIPLEPPSIQPTVLSTREEDGLIIEDVSWPSIDGDTVPAFIVRPARSSGRLPAVVCLHGSSTNRDVNIAPKFGYTEWTRYGTNKKMNTLAGWARELARRGYVTLSITQRGLDSRLPDTEARNKALLVNGRNVMGTIIYEIRQAVTYLRERPEVDPEKIGMTGISFGGITTFYTWLVDDRIAAAAPICGGVGSVQEFIKHGARSYHGIYWWVPGMLTKGDHGEFAAAMAPRPLMLWAPRSDIGMPNQGIDRFLEVAEPAFQRAGAADRLVVHRPPGEHAMSIESFEAAFQFFQKFLKGNG